MTNSMAVAAFLMRISSPTMTDAQMQDAVSDAAHTVFVETACMPYYYTETAAADIDPANYPSSIRGLIADAVKEGRSVNPTRDQCVHLYMPMAKTNGWL